MIIDLEIAKSQIRRLDDYDDDRIMLLLDQATAIVLDFLKLDADEYEDETGANDVPVLVGAAILLVLETLYLSPEDDPLSQAVKSILHRLRDPAMA